MLDTMTRNALERAREIGYEDALQDRMPDPSRVDFTVGDMARDYYLFGWEDGWEARRKR